MFGNSDDNQVIHPGPNEPATGKPANDGVSLDDVINDSPSDQAPPVSLAQPPLGRPTESEGPAPTAKDPTKTDADTSTPSVGPTATPLTHDLTSVEPTAGLLDLKQKALEELSPLVSHLDQSPEEHFKTTMMMIQATDDRKLVDQAYKAAQAIPDEKAKAQALLDVVNEINYFTQNNPANKA